MVKHSLEDRARVLKNLRAIRVVIHAEKNAGQLLKRIGNGLRSSGLEAIYEDTENCDAELHVYYMTELRPVATQRAPAGPYGIMHTYGTTVRFGYEMVHPEMRLISREATTFEPELSPFGHLMKDGDELFQESDVVETLTTAIKRSVETGALR